MKYILKISLVLLLVFVTVLTGCSSNETVNNAEENKKQENNGKQENNSDKVDEQITIEFWSGPTYKNVEGVDSEEFGDFEKAKIAEFQKEHPNITINFQIVPWDGIKQKMTVAITGDNHPDIILDSLERRLLKYVNTGKMEPIDDFIENDKSDFQEGMIEPLSFDGKLYGIPISMNPEYVFLNKTIFENKGLTNLIPQDRDWTFVEAKEALKQVTGDGIYGTAFFAGNEQADEMQLQYIFGMGAKQWNDDRTKIVMDQYPEAAEAIKWMKGMVVEGIAAPGPATTDIFGALELFKQGKLAMLPFAQSLYSIIEAGIKDGSVMPDIELYGIKPLHAEGKEPMMSIAGIHGYAVAKQTNPKKREAIKQFVQFMTSSDNVKAMAKSANYAPARNSSIYEVTNTDLTAIMAEVGSLSGGNLGKSNPKYNEVRAMWFPTLQAAFLDSMTPEEAIKDYTKKANDLLGQ